MAPPSHRRLRTGLALGALLIALAACGPLPRPFKPDDKDQASLVEAEAGAAVLVLALAGDAPGDPGTAAKLLAESLRDLGIAAETEAERGERTLSGRARLTSAEQAPDAIAISWQITDPSGGVVGSFSQASQLPAGLWAQGQPAAVGSVMARAAQQAAAMLRVQEPGQALGRSAKPRLVLLPMEGLPGDGALSLPRALERALSAADYEIGWEVQAEDLLILADLTITPDTPGTELVSFTWWVVRAGDGVDLGKIEQARQLPQGSLEGRWGIQAEAIAEGAAEGIATIIQRRWRAGRALPQNDHLARLQGRGPLIQSRPPNGG